jgi:hypothetical protein
MKISHSVKVFLKNIQLFLSWQNYRFVVSVIKLCLQPKKRGFVLLEDSVTDFGGYLRLLEVTWGYLRLLEATWGCLRLLEVTWGYLRLLEAAWGYLRLLEATWGCSNCGGWGWWERVIKILIVQNQVLRLMVHWLHPLAKANWWAGRGGWGGGGGAEGCCPIQEPLP